MKWVMIAHEDCMELHFTKDIVGVGLAGDTILYYMALVTRHTAKLQVTMVLLQPTHSLALSKLKSREINSNDDNIWAIEQGQYVLQQANGPAISF